MNKNQFVEKINQITFENKTPIFYHKTKPEYLENILKDEALLPLNFRSNYNLNFISQQHLDDNMRQDMKEKYLNSVFVSMKIPNRPSKLYEFFNDNKDDETEDETEDEIIFLIDPFSIDKDIFENSFMCYEWHYGRFNNNECRKWKSEKDIKYNFKVWENFIDKKYEQFKTFKTPNYNEIVIRNSKGINFKDVLSKNPKGVIIVIKTSKPENYEKIVKNYNQYEWIFINSKN